MANVALQAAEILKEIEGKSDVGLCTRKRAEYLMMAPSVAGTGGILVGYGYLMYLTDDLAHNGYVCWGTIGDEPVSNIRGISADQIVAALRETVEVAS